MSLSLIKDFSNHYYCGNEGHEEEKVLGYCLYEKCQSTSAFCLKCLTKKHPKFHKGHKDQCLEFNDIFFILDKKIESENEEINQYQSLQNLFSQCKQKLEKYFPQKQKEFISRLSTIERKAQQINKKISLTINQLEQLKLSLTQQNYQNLSENINIIKKIFCQSLSQGSFKQITIILQEQIQNVEQKIDLRNFQLLNKKLASIYLEKGRLILQQNLIQDSLLQFNKAILHDSFSVQAYFFKAYVLSEMQNHIYAIQCYDQVIRLNPNLAEAYNNKANNLQMLLKNYMINNSLPSYDLIIIKQLAILTFNQMPQQNLFVKARGKKLIVFFLEY